MRLAIRMPFQDAIIIRRVPLPFALLWKEMFESWGGKVAVLLSE
jgi:hypothetical protein